MIGVGEEQRREIPCAPPPREGEAIVVGPQHRGRSEQRRGRVISGWGLGQRGGTLMTNADPNRCLPRTRGRQLDRPHEDALAHAARLIRGDRHLERPVFEGDVQPVVAGDDAGALRFGSAPLDREQVGEVGGDLHLHHDAPLDAAVVAYRQGLDQTTFDLTSPRDEQRAEAARHARLAEHEELSGRAEVVDGEVIQRPPVERELESRQHSAVEHEETIGGPGTHVAVRLRQCERGAPDQGHESCSTGEGGRLTVERRLDHAPTVCAETAARAEPAAGA